MNYKLTGDSAFQMARIFLGYGESVRIERGAMVYMNGVELEARLNTRRSGIEGLLSAFGRSYAGGESMFITRATGTAPNSVVAIAPALPGRITRLTVGRTQYRLNDGAFFACDETVNYRMEMQNIGQALLSGTGGLFVMETEGQGDLLVNSYGDVIELECTPGNSITIDNGHVVAWDRRLNYSIEISSGIMGFRTGEGLVNRFSGSGKILIQTRNIQARGNAIK